MAAQLDRVSQAEGGEDGARIGAVAVENEKTEDSGLLHVGQEGLWKCRGESWVIAYTHWQHGCIGTID